MVKLIALVLSTMVVAIAGQGYGGGSSDYEPPSPKLKFNIGFNVPSMSISLPKLELPQISIRASIKQKKPFTLAFPKISFNSHVSASEDNDEGNSYGSAQGGYEQQQQNAGYGQGGNSNNYGGGNNNYGGGNDVTSAYAYNTPDTTPEFPGGYRAAAASEYNRPATAGYGAGPVQDEGLAYQPSSAPSAGYGQGPSNNYNSAPSVGGYNNAGSSNNYNAVPSNSYGGPNNEQPLNNYNGPRGFQGQAVHDYKASSSNYYAPPPPSAAPANNNYHQQQPQQHRAPAHLVQAAPAPYHRPNNVGQQERGYSQQVAPQNNYGQRIAAAHQEYQRRATAASEIVQYTEYPRMSPRADFSSWRPVTLNHHRYMIAVL